SEGQDFPTRRAERSRAKRSPWAWVASALQLPVLRGRGGRPGSPGCARLVLVRRVLGRAHRTSESASLEWSRLLGPGQRLSRKCLADASLDRSALLGCRARRRPARPRGTAVPSLRASFCPATNQSR